VVVPAAGAGRISAVGSIGNIGGQILGRCRVTFDYPRSRIAFEPTDGFERPFETDMSGMSISRRPEGTMVRYVNPGTPAAESGVQVGDRVVTVDGEPVERVDPAALRLRFQQEGRPVRMQVERAGRTLPIEFTLRRLL
jgi:C-terminal processing protease CtpA/Prc